MKYQFLFGPIPSRRLGVSLGVDLVPHKVCNLNCVYCESGKTTRHTMKRDSYVKLNDLIPEIDDYLSQKPELDYITLSGAGEPSLNIHMGEVIDHIREHYPQYNLALITNSLLFSDPQVRAEAANVDLVLPSLDAAGNDSFQKINRPYKAFKVDHVIRGLIDFRKEFNGIMWLEVFIVPGINDSEQEIELLKEALLKIKPDKIQLNTLDRPGTLTWVEAATKEMLEKIAGRLQALPVEIVARVKKESQIKSLQTEKTEIILSTIKRRPCTASDLAQILDTNLHEINKHLKFLLESEKIAKETKSSGTFYKIR